MKSNFMVVSSGRSGSHLLMSLVASHPKIFAEKKELFLFGNGAPFRMFPPVMPYYLMGQIRRLREVLRSSSSVEADIKVLTDYVDDRENTIFGRQDEIESYGFNFFISQLEAADIRCPLVKVEDFIECLINYKVVHLYRKNVARQALSILVKRERKKTNNNARDKKIKINLRHLEWLINNWLLKDLKREEHVTARYSPLKICYEDDLLNPDRHQETADKVFDYLGFESHLVYTSHRRDGSSELESYIENAHEVRLMIKKYCPEVESIYY